MYVKFREFYLGDRVFVKDFRKEDIWWLGLVVERSRLKLYVVVLNNGWVWKRYVDYVRRDNMYRAVLDSSREMEF